MPLGMEVDLSPGDLVLDGDPALFPKRRRSPGAEPPQFSAHVYCGQTAGWIKMALGMEVGLGPVYIVLDGDTAPLPKKGQSPPNFPPIFIVAKRHDASRCRLVWRQASAQASLYEMGTQPLTPKGAEPHPIFGLRLSWPIGCVDQDAAWYGSRPRPRPHCTGRGHSSRERGTAAPPSFRSMSIVATVAHLSCC